MSTDCSPKLVFFFTWLRIRVGSVVGWPFFTLGCELGARQPAISEKLCDIESAELSYFESALFDAIEDDAVEPEIPRAEALSLRAAVEGILARARMLNDPDELCALTALPANILVQRETPAMTDRDRLRLYTKRQYDDGRRGSVFNQRLNQDFA